MRNRAQVEMGTEVQCEFQHGGTLDRQNRENGESKSYLPVPQRQVGHIREQ
jgi:hypothetical protein